MIGKDVCGLDEATQDTLRNFFRRYSAVERVILYGSRAKGTFKPGSDIDLAIVAPGYKLPDLLALQVGLDELMLPFKIDAILLHQIDNDGLTDHIRRVGKLFYQP